MLFCREGTQRGTKTWQRDQLEGSGEEAKEINNQKFLKKSQTVQFVQDIGIHYNFSHTSSKRQ